jgi:hypothetical protein
MSFVSPIFRPVTSILTSPNRRFLNEALGAGAERLVQPARPLMTRIARDFGPETNTYKARSVLEQLVPNLIHGEQGLPLTALASGKITPTAAEFIAMMSDQGVITPDYAKDIANLSLVNQGALMRTARDMGERVFNSPGGRSYLNVASDRRRDVYSDMPESVWSYNRYDDPRMAEYFDLTEGPTRPVLLGLDPQGMEGLPVGDIPIIARALREMSLRGMTAGGTELDELLPLWRTQESIGTGGKPGRTGGVLSFTREPDEVLAAYDSPAFGYNVPARRVTFAGPEVFKNDLGEAEYQALADGLQPASGPTVFAKDVDDLISEVSDEHRLLILEAARDILAGKRTKLPASMEEIVAKNAQDIVELWG